MLYQSLTPNGVEFLPCLEALLSYLDAHLGQWSPPAHIVSHPAMISALLHWRTITNLLKVVPPRGSPGFAGQQVMATYQVDWVEFNIP